jgi:tetratricopeptide (TPR) repeat protein
MKRVLMCTAAACILAKFAFAQPDEWLQTMRAADGLILSGNYRDAAQKYRDALRLLGPADDLPLANNLNALANSYAEVARFADAEHNYQRSLAVLEKIGRKMHPDYALVETNLAVHYANHGDSRKGQSLLREAISIYMATVSPDDVRLALARSSLSVFAIQQRHYGEAEELLTAALEAFRKNPEEAKGREPVALNNLGTVRRYQGRLTDAIPFFEQAIASAESAFGPDHPILVRMISNVATMYGLTGRFADADTAFQRAIEIARTRLGPDHPLYGSVLLNYSGLLRREGNKRQAKKLEATAHAILQDDHRRNGDGMTVDVSAFALK